MVFVNINNNMKGKLFGWCWIVFDYGILIIGGNKFKVLICDVGILIVL